MTTHPAVAAAARYGFDSSFVAVGDRRFHLVRHGEVDAGRAPLLLLHGWPEFWLSWRKVMPRLGDRFALLAPDLRGFGATGKEGRAPSRDVGPDAHATDMLGLLDALGLAKVGVVSHDVGAYVAQVMARKAPERIAGLYFFDCPYPGIGRRWAAPGHIGEIWYQTFNQQPWAAELVGSSRANVALYIGNMLRHWSHREDAFDADLDTWVDNYAWPGNLQGGFDWYGSVAESRLATIEERAPHPGVIGVPTRVFWGRHDPVLKAEWTDRLGEYFSDFRLDIFEGAGHFPHMEEPERAAEDIRAFFAEILWR